MVLFRDPELRKSMYFVNTEWNGGIYASPTVAGSRPGALIATTWASLMSMGKNGFSEAATEIGNMAKTIKKAYVFISSFFSHSNVDSPVCG